MLTYIEEICAVILAKFVFPNVLLHQKTILNVSWKVNTIKEKKQNPFSSSTNCIQKIRYNIPSRRRKIKYGPQWSKLEIVQKSTHGSYT